MGKPIQETKEAAGQNGNAIKALPLESPVGYGGRKSDWIRILRHLFSHKVRRPSAEHDVLEHDVLEHDVPEGMRSEV
jgi:hypothetical protein